MVGPLSEHILQHVERLGHQSVPCQQRVPSQNRQPKSSKMRRGRGGGGQACASVAGGKVARHSDLPRRHDQQRRDVFTRLYQEGVCSRLRKEEAVAWRDLREEEQLEQAQRQGTINTLSREMMKGRHNG